MTRRRSFFGALLGAFLAVASPRRETQPPGYTLPPPPPMVMPPQGGFEFHAPSAAADGAVAETMRDLALRMVPVYEEKRDELYLSNLSALQLVSRVFGPAADSRRSLAERRGAIAGWPADRAVLLDLYATAKEREAAGGITFPTAFRQVFSETVPTLDDRTAEAFSELLARPAATGLRELQQAFDALRARGTIELKEGLDLVWLYLYFDAARGLAMVAPSLDVDEYRRRFAAGEDVVVRTRGDTEIVARFVRPNTAGDRKLPALLEYTLHVTDADARACAARGYVGVLAHPRLREGRKGRITPFEHDGEDARAVIEWIAQQPWSDGRVAMVGSGYGGFAAWAVAKKPPAALKAIVTADATAPGIDFPTENGVFRNEAYRWATEHTQGIPEPVLAGDAAWQALDLAWYLGGRPYRDLDRMSKKPNRVFRRWLGHPSYDRYWQKMIPFGREFARVDVPVLSTTGTYADGAVGAQYYFTEHLRHKPDADHTLLVGPWGDLGLRDLVTSPPGGAVLDTAARIDLREVRFAWLDHVFKGTPLPPLLSHRVNVQVAGANRWRHADTVVGLATPTRFYLEPSEGVDRLRLVEAAPPADAFLQQLLKLDDRTDVARVPMGPIVARNLAIPHSLTFVSEPLAAPLEIVGSASGLLDFTPGRMDVDLNVSLYESLPNGDYVRLASPDEFRASYLRDRVHRRLLKAGVRQSVVFRGGQIASRRLQAGSRIVVVIGVNKRPDREINYGSGKDVSVESKRDGRKPLKIRWYGGSYVDLPVAR